MIAKLEVVMKYSVKIDIGFHSSDDVNRIHEVFKKHMAVKEPFNINIDVRDAQPGTPSSITYYFIPENIVCYSLITFAQAPFTSISIP